jgi:putative aldouronate transport system substrate-binding protein
MNQWYKAGYLSSDFSMSESQIFAAFDSGKLGMYYGSVDAVRSRTANLPIKIESAPFPRIGRDDKMHTAPPTWPVDISNPYPTVVTTKCRQVEAAVKFLNYGYTVKGARTYNYGVEGVTYTMVNGEPKYTDYMLNPPNNMTASNTSYVFKIHFGPKLTDSDLKAHPGVVKSPEGVAWRKRWSDDPNVDAAYQMPPLTLKAEENTRRSAIMTNVNTYTSEMHLKFITGAEPLSSFPNYLKEIDRMGFQEAKKITQAAYDRYYGKK